MKLDQAEIHLGRATVDAQEYKALADAMQDTRRKWQVHHESELVHLAKLHQKQLTQVEQDKQLENQSLAESVEKLHMKVEKLKREKDVLCDQLTTEECQRVVQESTIVELQEALKQVQLSPRSAPPSYSESYREMTKAHKEWVDRVLKEHERLKASLSEGMEEKGSSSSDNVTSHMMKWATKLGSSQNREIHHRKKSKEQITAAIKATHRSRSARTSDNSNQEESFVPWSEGAVGCYSEPPYEKILEAGSWVGVSPPWGSTSSAGGRQQQ